MKNKIIVLSAVAVACMAWPARAADQKKGAEDLINPPSQPFSERGGGTNRFECLIHPEKASGLIGMQVQNLQNEKLGKVDDLAIDLQSGRIVEVILSMGGFLGVGDTTIAVPPEALRGDFSSKVLQMDANKEKLKAAPKFEMSKWAEYSQPGRITEVYRYYDAEPYFGTVQDGTRNPDLIVHAREAKVQQLGYVERATKIMGMPVKNLQDEKLGKVDNLVVDLPATRVVAVVLSSGGFLGMGDELSIVPPGALRFTPEHNGVILDANKDALTRAPHFKSSQWPELSEPIYVEQVYRVYSVEPYFSTNRTEVDNTALNARDRHSETLTPFDQGNNSADIQTTSSIRKEILARKGLSASARNVKIITANGRVTLRGPVNTDEEKRLLGEIASRIAGSDHVNNQLETKFAPTGRN